MPNQFKIAVPVFFIEDGDYITAYSPHLELSGYGKDIQDAMNSFDQCMEIFIEEGLKKGTLQQMLKNLGWVLSHGNGRVFTPPAVPPQFLPQHSVAKKEKMFPVNT